MVLTDTLFFLLFCLVFQVLPSVWPSHMDLDMDVSDQQEENHYFKMLELTTLIQQKFQFLFDVMSMERTFKMEAGTDSLSCHPSRCKMVVTSVDPALVVPCWWDQLTSLGGIIWLVARIENGTMGIWFHLVMPIFFKSENSIMYEGWNDCLVWCFPFLFNDVIFLFENVILIIV